MQPVNITPNPMRQARCGDLDKQIHQTRQERARLLEREALYQLFLGHSSIAERLSRFADDVREAA